MAKQPQEIKLESALRLRELLEEEKITQTALHEITGISENTISKILNHKAPLTQNIATLIWFSFPKYRVEWLMGLDDDKTEWEHMLKPVAEHLVNKSCFKHSFELLLEGMGLKLELENVDGIPDMTTDEFCDLPSDEMEVIISKMLDSGLYSAIYDSDNHKIGRISNDDLNSVIQDIADYAEFKIKKYCQS